MTVEKVICIGGGSVGQGITEVIARKGMKVTLVEFSEELCQKAIVGISKSLDYAIRRWGITATEKEVILSHINTTPHLEEACCKLEGGIIVEISGKKEKKFDRLKKISKVIFKDTILITTVSVLTVTEAAAETAIPERVIGMHFFHPLPSSPVVEVIKGEKTSSETEKRALDFIKHLGKKPLLVKENPGYIAPRVMLPYINEAIRLLMDEVAGAEDIDKAISEGYDIRLGPLRLADEIGLDLVLNWNKTLYEKLNDPTFIVPSLLEEMVQQGKLGKKSGEGFFSYTSGKE